MFNCYLITDFRDSLALRFKREIFGTRNFCELGDFVDAFFWKTFKAVFHKSQRQIPIPKHSQKRKNGTDVAQLLEKQITGKEDAGSTPGPDETLRIIKKNEHEDAAFAKTWLAWTT